MHSVVFFLNIEYKEMQGMNNIKVSECGGIPCTYLLIPYMHISASCNAFINCGILQSSEL